MPSKDNWIFMGGADIDFGWRVVVGSGAADVSEPCLVFSSHRLDDIGPLGSDVILFERVGGHIVKFEFRLAVEVFASEPTAVE